MNKYVCIIFLLCYFPSAGQDIALLSQFNGHYDYLAIGNTLNTEENENNNGQEICTINTSSSATLSLSPTQQVAAAYLYWAGSGDGDFEIELNGQSLTAQRTFHFDITATKRFFSAFYDVTTLVSTQGNGNYTLSGLDLTEAVLDGYCEQGINFGGWAIIIVYEDNSLPLNQVMVFDGLQGVPDFVSIELNNLNVIDNENAKIGFLAWEGDANLDDESLTINGNVLSNAINPSNNPFNGTNSFTNSDELYNMDLDVYDIENNISPGDNSAIIQLSSDDDIVAVNNIVTVLNSQLPEPTSEITNVETTCGSREIIVDYTIHNTNATDPLPPNTPILFYAENQLIGQTITQNEIPIDGAENGQIMLQIPAGIPDNFTLTMNVNLDSDGNPVNPEIDSSNNADTQTVQLLTPHIENPLDDISTCDDDANDGFEFFDLTPNEALAIGNQQNVAVTFYTDELDAEAGTDFIDTPANFENTETPQVIYVRLTSTLDPDCYVIDSFILDVYYSPYAVTADDIMICDDATNDGVSTFDLTQQSNIILDNQPQSELHYYNSITSADLGQNEIQDPSNFQNTESPQIIYARVQNPQHPECYSLSQFTLIVNEVGLYEGGKLNHCDEGFNSAIFDLYEIEDQLDLSPTEEITGFYPSIDAADHQTDAISSPENYANTESPEEIYVRTETNNPDECYSLYTIDLSVINCPPEIPKGFSPNGDGINDTFEILGLYDIFERFDIKIYNRYGTLIYEGDNSSPPWDGRSNRGLTAKGNIMPSGTYYYVLNLHDPYYDPIKSWVYLNR